MLLRLIFLFCIISISQTYAQKYTFGDVSKEELQETLYEHDPETNAAILYKHRESYIKEGIGDFTLISKMYKKIKIYNNNGFDHATESIYIYKKGGTRESINKIKAVTYNLVNGKIEKSSLDKTQIFESNIAFNLYEMKFTLPNVKAGSVIEIEYELNSPYYTQFSEIVFQHEIPVKKFYAEISTPDVFKYNKMVKGFEQINILKEQRMDQRIGLEVNIDIYTRENIPALVMEPYMDNPKNYRGAVTYELSAIEAPQLTKYFATTWDDVAREIGNSDDYTEQLDRTKLVRPLLEGISIQATDSLQIIKSIFEYVKSNFVWNKIDGKFLQNGLKKAIKEKTGNIADINFILIAMLREAGFNANPLLISTKTNGIPLFPTIEGLNSVIAHVELANVEYLMDATSKMSDINLLPLHDYNWRGIYINNDKKIWRAIDLNSPEISKNQTDLMVQLDADGSAEGQMRQVFDKHEAMDFRFDCQEKSEANLIAANESKFNEIEISKFSVSNLESFDKKPGINFSLYSEDCAELIGNKLYISPVLFLQKKENPFKKEQRQFPIDFGYPFESKKNIIINIPEGFTIEFVPESRILQLPDELGEARYLYNRTPKGLQVTTSFKINKSVLTSDVYTYLRDFYQKMIEVESEKIIIAKL